MSRRRAAAVTVALCAALAAAASVASSGAAPYRDDAAVRASLRAIPGVRAALAAGRQRRAAVLVNRWLAPRVPAAYDARAIVPTFGSSAHALLDAFAARRGGVYCDGAADALVAALRLLGIATSRLDFGYAQDGLTHTTVVVTAGGRYWLVDPTFALDLRTADGRPLDLVAAWRAAAGRTRGAVAMRTGDLSARPVLGGPRRGATCADHPRRWTMCGLGTYLRAFAPALRSAGYPPGERGLLLLSLRGPLLSPDVYGVPAGLLRLRAAVAR